ncbi:MAG: hypothetical protein M0Q42_10180 [Xanthomonadales bacterium]|nr:hypothetical protein [Xanthomonadales bacterium]
MNNDDIRIDSRQIDTRTAGWIGIGLAFVFLMLFWMGYQVGSDRAERDNYRDCVAAGGVDCPRG